MTQMTGGQALVQSLKREEADPDLIERAAQLLGRAERPLISSGGGTLPSGGWEALRELAAIVEAPVSMTANGCGAVSDHDYHAQNGMMALGDLLPAADVVLAAGTRYVMPPRMSVEPPAGQAFIDHGAVLHLPHAGAPSAAPAEPLAAGASNGRISAARQVRQGEEGH